MIRRVITYLIEAVTALTSIFLFAAVECSIWFGFLGLIGLLLLLQETNAWEGGV